MTFTVKASLGKKIGYGIFDVFLCVFLVFWVLICNQAILDSMGTGMMVFFIALFFSFAALFLFAIYSTLYAIHLVITVDTNENTLVVKRIFRRPLTLSLYDITSWKVKIISGKSGEASRHLIISFEGGKITAISLLDNWEKLRAYLNENAADKLKGDR